MIFTSTNPYTGQPIATYPAHSPAQIEQKLAQADRAFADWRARPLPHRTDALRRLAAHLLTHKQRLGHLITSEMGKTTREAVAEIEKCASGCLYYADHAETILADAPVAAVNTDGTGAWAVVRWQPLGPVLAVMPWNFPFWQVFRFAAPAIAAGNVALLKHAPNTMGCAEAMETIFRDCDLPDGVFTTLRVDVPVVADLLADRRVRAVTLTGSGRAGASVAGLAGQHLKKSVLELGGSDPLIVLSDADLDRAAEVAVRSRMQNAGQSCIAAKRFIVERSVKEAFMEQIMHHIGNIVTGDPTNPATTMGPMARADLADAIERQIAGSERQGAVLRFPHYREGNVVAPMLLDNVRPGMVAFEEETFGPLATLIEAADEADAVRLANASSFGLGAAVWSADEARANRVAWQLEAGSVFINGLMRSDARVPFGGIKQSGYGRELADIGLTEFMNRQTLFRD
jgi:succinate-semialdehyde dehydrogenase / glutarate-semialdehyde dehydrogenase